VRVTVRVRFRVGVRVRVRVRMCGFCLTSTPVDMHTPIRRYMRQDGTRLSNIFLSMSHTFQPLNAVENVNGASDSLLTAN
jgi:hypothetical protein